jgi:branched-chain amino acid transport system ATP-binding protein
MGGRVACDEVTVTAQLTFRNVTLGYDRHPAVHHLNGEVTSGALIALIGPNGAGKSTLINMCAGSYTVSAGRILLDAVELQRLKKHQIAQAGVARTYQNIRLFDGMTVLQNLEVCLFAQLFSATWSEVLLPRAARRSKALRVERCLAELTRFGLEPLAEAMAADLSYGNQKLLEIARATMLRPKVLMLDEPAAGLNHDEVDVLRGQIKRVRDTQHVTVLLVEHHMSLVMSVSDKVVAIDFGKKIADGTPDEVRANPRVIKAYLGETKETKTDASGGSRG